MNWKLWIPIFCILLASLLGWGVDTTLRAWDATPSEEFKDHEKENNSQFQDLLKEIQRQRESIEEKLDDIQEKL